MNPEVAAKIVAAVDVEIARRRRRKLDDLIASWAEDDSDSLYAFCRQLEAIQWPDIPDPTDPEEAYRREAFRCPNRRQEARWRRQW
jgi:hypothetical protein